MARSADGPVLSRRALNRALLARQLLLARERREALHTVEHLVGMQAQSPEPPYYGLWSRLDGFDPAELSQLVLDRQVVRIALMRSTIHLVSAADCLAFRPLVQPVLDRSLQANWGARLGGVDRESVTARGRELVEQQPRTFSELGALLAAEHPGRDPDALAMAVRTWVPLVQVPPRGVWGRSGSSAHTSAENWLGLGAGSPGSVRARAPAGGQALEDMVLRYLAAFGPASVADVQKWSGLTRLGTVVDRLTDRLLLFRDGNGRQLYDLPDAPRPDPETPAPPRLLGEYDNVLLSHADRSHIYGDTPGGMVMTRNGIVLSAVLVDGFLAGRWRIARPAREPGAVTVTLTTFRRVGRQSRAALEDEARALLAFAAPGPAVGSGEVRFEVSTNPVG